VTAPHTAMTTGSYHLRRRQLSISLGLGILLARLGLAPPVLSAQDQPPPERLSDAEGVSAQPIFFSQTKLVTLAFTFRPSKEHKHLKSRNAPELGVEDIEILDNGVSQRVAVLERTGKEGTRPPTDVILLFDAGRDFRPYINPRVVNFHVFEELENVRFSIYGFSDSAYRLSGPTADMAQLTAAMANLSRLPFVPSIVRDAIVQTIQDAVTISGSRPRMLVVFSNFTTNCQMPPAKPSQHSWDEVEGLARYYDIALFPVVVSPRRLLAFSGLGEATGGKTLPGYAVEDSILQEVLKYFRTQKRSEYLAGFYPGAALGTDGELHKIVVRLKGNLGEISGGVRSAAYYQGHSGQR
jgi:hypothetical protein